MIYNLLPPCVSIATSSVTVLNDSGVARSGAEPAGIALFVVDEFAPGDFRHWLQVCATDPRCPGSRLGRWLSRRLARDRVAVGRDLAGTILPTLRTAAYGLAPTKAQRLHDRISALIGEHAIDLPVDGKDHAFADLYARAGRPGMTLTNAERAAAWLKGDLLSIQRELAHQAVMSWAAWANATRATPFAHAEVVADALCGQQPGRLFGQHDIRHGAASIKSTRSRRPF